MNGRSNFKVKLDRMAIADITEIALTGPFEPLVGQMIMSGAPKHDVDTVNIILALQKYLNERRCETDFEVVINE